MRKSAYQTTKGHNQEYQNKNLNCLENSNFYALENEALICTGVSSTGTADQATGQVKHVPSMQRGMVTPSQIWRYFANKQYINHRTCHKQRQRIQPHKKHTLIPTGTVLLQQGLAVSGVAVHRHRRGPASGSTSQSHHSIGEPTYNSALQAKHWSVQADLLTGSYVTHRLLTSNHRHSDMECALVCSY
jgi:hypothetical protein